MAMVRSALRVSGHHGRGPLDEGDVCEEEKAVFRDLEIAAVIGEWGQDNVTPAIHHLKHISKKPFSKEKVESLARKMYSLGYGRKFDPLKTFEFKEFESPPKTGETEDRSIVNIGLGIRVGLYLDQLRFLEARGGTKKQHEALYLQTFLDAVAPFPKRNKPIMFVYSTFIAQNNPECIDELHRIAENIQGMTPLLIPSSVITQKCLEMVRAESLSLAENVVKRMFVFPGRLSHLDKLNLELTHFRSLDIDLTPHIQHLLTNGRDIERAAKLLSPETQHLVIRGHIRWDYALIRRIDTEAFGAYLASDNWKSDKRATYLHLAKKFEEELGEATTFELDQWRRSVVANRYKSSHRHNHSYFNALLLMIERNMSEEELKEFGKVLTNVLRPPHRRCSRLFYHPDAPGVSRRITDLTYSRLARCSKEFSDWIEDEVYHRASHIPLATLWRELSMCLNNLLCCCSNRGDE